ncbi:hypothetical protein PHMEG_00014682 [Phytophthora megakarya]|uniref:Uncharacterized protein n=1 Tax=Phytophthora megakarya TaxID=4795 RepID=A0A225W4S5_9STRA|nr:hypothetical protein PHMEG_00014682 [Phytophthora megakarya]
MPYRCVNPRATSRALKRSKSPRLLNLILNTHLLVIIAALSGALTISHVPLFAMARNSSSMACFHSMH